MSTTKRTTKTAAPAAKPITAAEAFEAGRAAFEEAIRNIKTTPIGPRPARRLSKWRPASLTKAAVR
jgi:hypothetical protein